MGCPFISPRLWHPIHFQVCRKLRDKLGTQFTFSTPFHPQISVQSESTIQVLKDMLRARVIDFRGHWDKLLPLRKFSYNNNYHSIIDMLLYGKGCSTHQMV